MYKQIETARLLIRPIETSDKIFFLNLLNTKGWLQFIGDRNVYNETDAEKYIQNILDSKNHFYSVFELKHEKQPVGIITFLYRNNHQFPDIGFAMLPEFEKKGLALEATKHYLEAIISEKKVKKVIAITQADNSKSIRIIEQLGLKYDSVIQNNAEKLHLYSKSLIEKE